MGRKYFKMTMILSVRWDLELRFSGARSAGSSWNGRFDVESISSAGRVRWASRQVGGVEGVTSEMIRESVEMLYQTRRKPLFFGLYRTRNYQTT